MGILKKGFVIHNDVCSVKIPKNTVVIFGIETIQFKGTGVFLVRVHDEWYADCYGAVLSVRYDRQHPPYPLSYFR